MYNCQWRNVCLRVPCWLFVNACVYFCCVANKCDDGTPYVNNKCTVSVLNFQQVVGAKNYKKISTTKTDRNTQNNTVHLDWKCELVFVVWFKVCAKDTTNILNKVRSCCGTEFFRKCIRRTFASQEARSICSTHLRPIVRQLIAANTQNTVHQHITVKVVVISNNLIQITVTNASIAFPSEVVGSYACHRVFATQLSWRRHCVVSFARHSVPATRPSFRRRSVVLYASYSLQALPLWKFDICQTVTKLDATQ